MWSYIMGLPPNCPTMVALGGDPWDTEHHLLRRVYMKLDDLYGLTYDAYRNHDETRPYEGDPIELPERHLTDEQRAELDRHRADIEAHAELEESRHLAVMRADHAAGMSLLTGRTSMAALSVAIQESMPEGAQ